MGATRDHVKGLLDDAILGDSAVIEAVFRGEEHVTWPQVTGTLLRNAAALNASVVFMAEQIDDLRAQPNAHSN